MGGKVSYCIVMADDATSRFQPGEGIVSRPADVTAVKERESWWAGQRYEVRLGFLLLILIFALFQARDMSLPAQPVAPIDTRYCRALLTGIAATSHVQVSHCSDYLGTLSIAYFGRCPPFLGQEHVSVGNSRQHHHMA